MRPSISRVSSSLLQFDYSSSNAGPGPSMRVKCRHSSRIRERAINRQESGDASVAGHRNTHQHNSLPAVTGTKGTCPRPGLSAFAGRSNVKLGFSIEGYEGQATKGIDNIQLGEGHTPFRGLISPGASSRCGS